MTREKFFRGKRTDNGEWVEGFYFNNGKKAFISAFPYHANYVVIKIMYEVDPATVGQFTGLIDKNGKKIFEGDIVKTKKYGRNTGNSNVNDFDIFTVVYEPCMFRIVNKNRGFNLVDDGYSNFEVISNIHDNPDLFAKDNDKEATPHDPNHPNP